MLLNGPLSSESSNQSKEDIDRLGIIVLAAMSFLPMIGRGNILRLMLTAGLVCHQMALKRYKIAPEIKRILVMMVTSAIIPAVVVFAFEGSINIGFWLHEFIRILFYCMLIPVVYNYRTTSEFLFKVCIVVLIVNFGIQFMQWRGLGNINGWIYEYYAPKDKKFTHLLLAAYTGVSFRAGSVFLNPNVCMVIPCTILGVLLQRNSIEYSIWNYVWIGIALFSVLLTGSRTAFILSMIIVGFCTWRDKKAGKIKWLLPIILILGLWMNAKSLENFRAFDIESAMHGSGNTKISGILIYLKITNLIYMVTGSCGSRFNFGLDNEWGYIYMFYGILGLIWYIRFLKLFWRNKELFPLQTLATTLVICLIACTASVFLCMPVCSFFCAVALPQFIAKGMREE